MFLPLFTPSAYASTHIGGTDPIANASASSAGLMSKDDKTKLDGIQAGAEVNQNAFSIISVSGQSSIEADTKTDTLTLANGTGITITTDATNDKITITAHEHSNKALLDSYTQTEANLADAVSKNIVKILIQELPKVHFYIGTDGPRIKNDNGQIQIRNNDDTGFADLKVNNLFVEGTQTIINSNGS